MLVALSILAAYRDPKQLALVTASTGLIWLAPVVLSMIMASVLPMAAASSYSSQALPGCFSPQPMPFSIITPRLINAFESPFSAAFSQSSLAWSISFLTPQPVQQQSPSLLMAGGYYMRAATLMQQTLFSVFLSMPMPCSENSPIQYRASQLWESSMRICLVSSTILSIVFSSSMRKPRHDFTQSSLHCVSLSQAPIRQQLRALSMFSGTPTPFQQHLPRFRNALGYLSSAAFSRYFSPLSRFPPSAYQLRLGVVIRRVPKLLQPLGKSCFLVFRQYLRACSGCGSMKYPEPDQFFTPFSQMKPRSVSASRWPSLAAFSQNQMPPRISAYLLGYMPSKISLLLMSRFSRYWPILQRPQGSFISALFLQNLTALLRSFLTNLPLSQMSASALRAVGWQFFFSASSWQIDSAFCTFWERVKPKSSSWASLSWLSSLICISGTRISFLIISGLGQMLTRSLKMQLNQFSSQLTGMYISLTESLAMDYSLGRDDHRKQSSQIWVIEDYTIGLQLSYNQHVLPGFAAELR